MTGKWLVALLGIGAVLYSVDAPKPDAATADDELMAAAIVPHGVAARLGYGFGAIGSHMVGGMVLSGATDVQNDLQGLRTSLKAKKGKDGENARAVAKVAAEASGLAIQSVYTADPVVAVRSVMKAKNNVDLAKRLVSMPNN
jgi:hypothetical protein